MDKEEYNEKKMTKEERQLNRVELFSDIYVDKHNHIFGKCKCGSIINITKISSFTTHFNTQKHISKIEQLNKEIQEIPLLLPTISQEIQEIPIPDVEPEPVAEIPSSIPEPIPTKAEIRKQKKKEYMREYMIKYHAKRYNEDAEYREYRKEMSRKSTCKMGSRYVKAYQYIKENNIQIFDENGN